MNGYKKIPCHGCGGHGLVSNYGSGDDFYGAKECRTCSGSGTILKTPKGRYVKYYGGPFC